MIILLSYLILSYLLNNENDYDDDGRMLHKPMICNVSLFPHNVLMFAFMTPRHIPNRQFLYVMKTNLLLLSFVLLSFSFLSFIHSFFLLLLSLFLPFPHSCSSLPSVCTPCVCYILSCLVTSLSPYGLVFLQGLLRLFPFDLRLSLRCCVRDESCDLCWTRHFGPLSNWNLRDKAL